LIVITRQNLSEIRKIYFHDAEISEVVSNYIEHTVKMPIKLYRKGSNGIAALITFENTVNLDISFLEPWGAGMYVLGVVVKPVEITSFKSESFNIMDCFKVCFELNSGDEINVVASKMMLIEKED
jgi:hypothetical protein